MEDIPPLFILIIDTSNFILKNYSFIASYIPRILQIIGMGGWLWEGSKVYRDKHWQFRYGRFFRATLVWLLGKILEIFLTGYNYYTS